MAKKEAVLFLCGGNSCRSQMGEAILRHRAGERYDVYSAGIEPTGEVHPLAIRVLREKGYETAGLRSKGTDEFLGRIPADWLITVCDAAAKRCPAFWPGMRTRLSWPFEDPGAFEGTDEEKLAKFREIRDLLEARIDDWLKRS